MRLFQQVQSTKRTLLVPFFLLFVISAVFFYPSFTKGYIPFPGDLLIAQYEPYKSYSYMGYAPGGYPHKAQDFDVLKLLYPAKEFAVDLLKKGEFSLWNPHNFSGNPHLANLQSGIFYPFTLLFLLLPSFTAAWFMYIFIQPLLTGVFTILFLRELKLGTKASIFGGATFAFSSYMTVWMEYGNLGHTILWLPLSLWLAAKILQKPDVFKSIILVLILSASILAGYIQLAIYLFLYLFSFIVFYAFFVQKKRQRALLFIPIFLSPLLLCAVQLLPSIELFGQSSRSPYTPESFISLLIPIQHVITTFVPDFFGNPATRNYWLSGTYIERVSYIGVIPLFFAIYGFAAKRTALTWFFAVSLVVVFLLAFDTPISRLLFSHFLPPLLSTGVPSRIMYLFCFAASMLAAFGMESFMEEKKKKILLRTAMLVGSVYILLWIFVFTAPFFFPHEPWIASLSISKRNLILPSSAFMGAALLFFFPFVGNTKRYVYPLLFFITLFELFYFFHKITPFAPAETVYPKTEVFTKLKSIQGIDRSWGYGSAYIEANIQTFERLFSTDGYDPLHGKRYGEFVSTSKDGIVSASPPRSEADIVRGFGEEDLRKNVYRQKLFNVLGVKYILHKTALQEPDYQAFPSEIYNLTWQGGEWQIYENKQSLPRVFLASNYRIETDKQKIIDTLLDDKFDIQNTIVLEEEIVSSIKLAKDDASTVLVKSYQPNRVVVETKSKADTLLFLSDNYFPGWHVSVDNKRNKIYRANYAFRAVPVEKGEHEIIFWYYPQSFDLGLKISLGSILGLLLFGIGMRRR